MLNGAQDEACTPLFRALVARPNAAMNPIQSVHISAVWQAPEVDGVLCRLRAPNSRTVPTWFDHATILAHSERDVRVIAPLRRAEDERELPGGVDDVADVAPGLSVHGLVRALTDGLLEVGAGPRPV